MEHSRGPAKDSHGEPAALKTDLLVSDLSVLERAQIASKMASSSAKWPNVGAYFDISERDLKGRYGAHLPSLQLCVHLLDELAEKEVSIERFCKALEEKFIGLNAVSTFVKQMAQSKQSAADKKEDGHKVQKKIEPEALFSDLSAYREHIVDSKVTAKALHIILEEEKVIYGADSTEDSRQDLCSIPKESSYQDQSKSIVSLWSVEKLQFEGDHVKLSTKAFDTVYSSEHSEFRKLHPGEAFFGQPKGAFGSGFLVSDDLIVTAAHCVVGPKVPPVANIRFVFGFKMASKTDLAQVHKDDVYSGTLVDYRFNSATQEDWAVVRLNRKVNLQDHKPLEFDLQPVAVNHPVYIIGHPCGLPMKVASGAQVRSVEENWKYFKANLDSFGGNSGSPVFSSTTSKVVGILVRGKPDFIWDVSKNAMVAHVIPTTGPEGEEVTKITEVRLPENKNIAPQVAPVELRFQNLTLKVRHNLADEIATQLGKWRAIASYFSLRPDYIIAKVGDNELKCSHELVNMLTGKGVLVSELVKALTEYDMEGIVAKFDLAQ